MMRTSGRAIRTIFAKEVIDILRDRRALVATVILPVALYPALIGGMSYLEEYQSKRLREETLQVQIDEMPGGAGAPSAVPTVRRAVEGIERVELCRRDDPLQALREGDLDAYVLLESTGTPDIEQARVEIHYNGSLDRSLEALRRLVVGLQVFWKMALDARLGVLGVSAERLSPLAGVPEPVDESTGGGVLGRVIAMMLVVMSVSAAMYPALDLGAGEKERGTLETLLASPVRRRDIVLGKYLATAAIAGATALLNLTVMVTTFRWMAQRLPGDVPGGGMQIQPEAVAIILLVLVPLVCLFSALALALSTFARSYKEAQSYVTPLILLGVFPAMAAMAPGIELKLTWAGVPVLGTVLLFRELLAGVASAGETAIVLGTNVLYAALALAWAVRTYGREDVLFRG